MQRTDSDATRLTVRAAQHSNSMQQHLQEVKCLFDQPDAWYSAADQLNAATGSSPSRRLRRERSDKQRKQRERQQSKLSVSCT